MPNSNPEKYRKYMNTYMKKRWRKRKASAVKALGGKCVHCSSTENLQFDHKNPRTKKFTIAKMSSIAEAKFQKELAKCQLLCASCHIEKSREDISKMKRKGP